MKWWLFMRRDDSVYLHHILDAIQKIELYVQGVTEEAFSLNPLVQDAVVRQIEIIGEATRRLSSGLRSQNPLVPWRDITGMRDKLMHEYFGVDMEQVWLTLVHDTPYLKGEITNVLNTIQGQR
jgi:uncharacterized protein with HEPN domain